MDVQPPLVWLLVVAAVAVLLLMVPAVMVFVFWQAFRPKPEPRPVKSLDRSIDISALDSSGPPADVPQLEFYGCPVRLAVLVVAPIGRDGSIPEKEQLPELFDQFVPSFLQVVAAHQPLLRFWPAQVSAAGFTNSFFGQVRLPGDHGKGTPWCSIAGRFTALDKQYLAGLVCCGDGATGLGKLIIERELQWLDVLRVKS